MKIDFTPEQIQFMYGNLSQMTVPLGHPNGEEIQRLGKSCMEKLQAALSEPEQPKQKEPLASAVKPNDTKK